MLPVNFNIKDHYGKDVEFLVSLHESADTFVYNVLSGPYDFMVETVANPTNRELLDGILTGYTDEVIAGHAKRIRHELDHGII